MASKREIEKFPRGAGWITLHSKGCAGPMLVNLSRVQMFESDVAAGCSKVWFDDTDDVAVSEDLATISRLILLGDGAR